MQTPALELSILVDPCDLKTDHYSDTSVFYRLHFITLNAEGEVRNCSSSGEHGAFSDLVFRAFISWSNEFLVGSWETLYSSVYSAGLTDCERMLKTLKRIDRISSKLVIRPSSFGQYVALICAGLGIKRFACPVGKGGGWHTNTPYQIHQLQYLADRIDRSIEAAREAKFKPEVA